MMGTLDALIMTAIKIHTVQVSMRRAEVSLLWNMLEVLSVCGFSVAMTI